MNAEWGMRNAECGMRKPSPQSASGAVLFLVLFVCVGLRAQQDDRWTTKPVGTGSFTTMNVFVESGSRPLAAYQLTLNVAGTDARIVGIEGGDPGAFEQPPHYDPKAIQHQRVILAAFSTLNPGQLPQGKVRVATIHLQTKNNSTPRINLKLQTAAGADAIPIPAQCRAEERTGP